MGGTFGKRISIEPGFVCIVKTPRVLRAWAKGIAKRVFPRRFWTLKYKRLARCLQERELQLVPALCDARKISLDVGAEAGLYSVHMAACSRRVVAFEPRPGQARDLKRMFQAVGAPVSVECYALSDRIGMEVLRIPLSGLGRSTIEPRNSLESSGQNRQVKMKVEVRRLDDFKLEPVGCIKIDVEGHEIAVLRGAIKTLKEHRPNLLVESEDRHCRNAVDDLRSILQDQDYAGYFLLDGTLSPISEFDLSKHQNRGNIGGGRGGNRKSGIYINNFVFLPLERHETVLAELRAVLSAA